MANGASPEGVMILPTASQDAALGQSIPDRFSLVSTGVGEDAHVPLLSWSMTATDLVSDVATRPVAKHCVAVGQETAVRPSPRRVSCMVITELFGVIEPTVVVGPTVVKVV